MANEEIRKKIQEAENSVNGVSYIGNPKSNTVMYITKKVEGLMGKIQGLSNCLVFAEEGMNVSQDICEKNYIILTDNPQRDYAKFVSDIEERRFQTNRHRKMTLTEDGYYVGEGVLIGEDAYIEPGCLIGHDVIIGNHARIFAGAVIKNAVIGNYVVINEQAVVGAFGFTMAEDEQGNKFRIPTLGKVIVGDNVEIGANDNISCGSAGDTIIEDNVKIDALVHIGHDAHLRKNVEVTAGGIIGGFADIGEKTFIGVNSAIRNRIRIEDNCIIGMGSVVTKKVENQMTVVGNPARIFQKGD